MQGQQGGGGSVRRVILFFMGGEQMHFPVFIIPLAVVALLFIPTFRNIPPDIGLANGHFYAESAPNSFFHLRGYRVEDAAGIPFWTEYQRFGGAANLGYPISQRFQLDGFIVQATANVVMQWHPTDHKVYFLNLLDVLHNHGDDAWLLTQAGIPPLQPGATAEQGMTFDQIAQARLAALKQQNAAIWELYQRTPDALSLFGLPTSAAYNAGGAIVVRFQRAVMQQWLQDTPYAQKGQVTLADAAYLAMQENVFGGAASAQWCPPGALPGEMLRGMALVVVKQPAVQSTAKQLSLPIPSATDLLGLSPEEQGLLKGGGYRQSLQAMSQARQSLQANPFAGQ